MRRVAVFFDRDNTLIASDGYLGDPNKVVLIEGAAEAIAKCRQYGFKVVTVSNQSGVARGLFTEADVRAVNTRMDELLRGKNPNAIIDRHEYCPFHPEAPIEQYRQDSDLRKPKPGMLLKSAEELKLDLTRCWLVGDAPRDIEAGKAAGCRTILFTAPGLPASPEASKSPTVQPDFTANSLQEVVGIIAREVFIKSAPKQPTTPARQDMPAEDAVPTDSGAAGSAPKPPEPVARTVARLQPPTQTAMVSTSRPEQLLEQILAELKRQGGGGIEFSISKLLAGAVQAVALATLLLAFVNRNDPGVQPTLLFAIALQLLTIALLIMGRQR